MATRFEYGGLRQHLQTVAQGLRAAASGEVVARAAQAVADQVRKVASAKLRSHRESGAAAGETRVDVFGGLVQLHGMPDANGSGWSNKSYLSMHAWWPFRSGHMPPFVLRRAAAIFAAELEAALAGRRSPLVLAEEAAEEAGAEKARAKFKKDIASIYRKSAEGKAARARARKAARAHG